MFVLLYLWVSSHCGRLPNNTTKQLPHYAISRIAAEKILIFSLLRFEKWTKNLCPHRVCRTLLYTVFSQNRRGGYLNIIPYCKYKKLSAKKQLNSSKIPNYTIFLSTQQRVILHKCSHIWQNFVSLSKIGEVWRRR